MSRPPEDILLEIRGLKTYFFTEEGVVKAIESIDIAGNAAVAKAKWIIKNSDKTFECTDYLSLLRIKNKWKIVNKSWSGELK